jgi:hypothetical protein
MTSTEVTTQPTDAERFGHSSRFSAPPISAIERPRWRHGAAICTRSRRR